MSEQDIDRQKRSPSGKPKRSKNAEFDKEKEQIVEELRVHQVELELQNQELVESQFELQKSAEYFQIIFDNMPEPAFVINRLGLIADINAAGLNLLGFKARSLAISHSIHRLIGKDYGGWLHEVLHDEPGSHNQRRVTLKSAQGQLIPVDLSIVSVPEHGHYKGTLIVIARDLSAEIKVDVQRKQTQRIIDETDNLVVSVDQNRCITLVNKAFAKLCGKSRAALMGLPLSQALQIEELYEIDALFDNVFRGNRSRHKDSQRMSTRHGVEYFSCQAFPTQLDGEGDRGVTLIATKITELIHAHEKIESMVFTDQLTGTANRRLLEERLKDIIRSHSRHNAHFILCFLDLDHFKEINDVYGHQTGDHVLKTVSDRIVEFAREEDTVGRLGGDEFIIIFPGMTKKLGAERLAALLKRIQEPVTIKGHVIVMTGSIGVAEYPSDGESGTALMRSADHAMYQAKDGGKNRFVQFDSSVPRARFDRNKVVTELRSAQQRGEFFLLYQPIIDMQTTALVGAEVLLRWNSKSFSDVSTDDFIREAEENGLIAGIGHWVVEAALTFLSTAGGKLADDFRLAINVSALEFGQDNFATTLLDAIAAKNINERHIELELTETAAMSMIRSQPALSLLAKRGVSISLDDFGTGYSSLTFLRQLPLNKIKIDRSFIENLEASRDDQVICKSIINLAKELGMRVTAEGVETQAQCEFLKSQGCNYAQGFLFAEPMPAEDFAKTYLNKSSR